MSKKLENSLLFMWIVSFIAMMGSLFFSEVQHFEPCKLCWIQRILMYPLVIVLGVAYVQRNARIAVTSAIFSCIGAMYRFVSLRHSKSTIPTRISSYLWTCTLHRSIYQLVRFYNNPVPITCGLSINRWYKLLYVKSP